MELPVLQVAIVREVAETYGDCTVTYQQRQPIDVELARRQHRAYEDALRASGLDVIVLPAAPGFPDGCFVEDTAVVLRDTAVLASMATAKRAGEVQGVAECLGQWLRLVQLDPACRLEGGDVLKIGRVLLVGESGRTNAAGIASLAALAGQRGYEVRSVPVCGAVHLKTLATPLGDSMVIATRGVRAALVQALPGVHLLEVPDASRYAANVLRLGGDTVLVPSGFPVVARQIAELGLTVRELDISEFQKGEGGLTCLSIILETSDRRRLPTQNGRLASRMSQDLT